MEPKEKKAFEPSGLVPRSIVRTFERFRQQLLPGSETAAIREYRISRYQVLVSVRCLFTLLIIPIATNWLVSSWLLSPLVEHFWNTQQNEIFLNSYQEERAFAELESFSEKLFFESLLNTTNTINVNSVQSKPLTQYEAKGYKGLGVPFASAKVNPLNKLRVNPLASARVIPAFYKSSICAAKVNSPFNKFSKAWDPSVCDPLPLTQCGAKGYKGYGVCAGMRNNSYFNKRKNSCVSVRNSEGITFAPAEGIVLTNDSFSCNSTRNSKEITLATQMEDLQKAGGALYPLYPLAPGIELRRSYEGVLLYKSSICKSCNNELIQYEKYLPENKNSLTHNKSLIWVRSQVNTILSEFLRNSFGVSYPLPEYTKLRGIRGKEELLRQQEEFYTPYPVQSKRVVEVRGQQLKDTGAKTWGTEVKAPSSLFVPIESTYDNSLKIKEKVQNKILELAIYYNQQTIISITNIIGDIVSLVTLGCLFIWMKPEITILKSFLIEAIYSLSDTTKSFLLILLTDLLVGFHSPRGWETALELLLKHFGLPENQDFVFLFVATFPVLLDTVFKYWIFRHLNKISPSTVATYHSMIE